MPTDRFNTISSDLQALASRAEGHFAALGYSTKAEPDDLGMPGTPALRCKRHQTTVFVNVGRADLLISMPKWIAYCKSSNRDYRLCLVVPADYRLEAASEDRCRQRGIGVLRNGGGGLTEVVQGRDLAINMELPDLVECSVKGKKLLGPAYEKHRQGDWHGCFDEACRALEDLARKNLQNGVPTGRLKVVGKKGVIPLTSKQIRKATMGKLKDWYERITSPSEVETVLTRTLKSVVKDRNKEIHERHAARTETILRKKVGSHMWIIVSAIRIATK
jgi:hypothetical protein